MKITDEQRKAITCDGHTVVVACPGSGKTRTLIAKLLRCVDEVRDTPRRVGCITYTNTAVYEIEHRLRIYGATGDEDYCDVSTIHAFCQNNVLRHFYWKLPAYKDGYSILPPDCDRYEQIVDDICERYGLSDYAKSTFEQIGRRPNGQPITSAEIPHSAALDFWTRLQREGYIDFCNIVYGTYILLRENPSVARALGCRFAHLLVDEFQDTSALQVEILSLIAEHKRTKFFLVGDPEQSIYSFAGAERELMFSFAKALNANGDAKLLGNFRSSGPVVACGEKICPRKPPMYAAGEAAKWTEEPSHVEVADSFQAMTDHFLPMLDGLKIDFGKTAILASQWPLLRPLGIKLRNYSVPIVGPGARPYRRSHLFARLAEQICAYIDCPRPEFVKQAEKELFNLILTVTGRANFVVHSYSGRRVMFRLFRAGRRIFKQSESGVLWLQLASAEMGDILKSEGMLPGSGVALMTESVAGMLADMKKAGVDLPQVSISDLGMFADPEKSMKLMTIHQAKGREFDAVAIVALHDGIVPWHNKHNPLTPAGEAEGRRLFYVAATRAKRVLMFVTEKGHWRGKSRYLKEIGF